MSDQKKRTVTLTDARPVTIVEADWPVIATAAGDSWRGVSDDEHRQALDRNQLDVWTIRVREHADGRRLVYGVLDGSRVPRGMTSRRAGYLLTQTSDALTVHETAGNATIDAIKRVAAEIAAPDTLAQRCISTLPAEEI